MITALMPVLYENKVRGVRLRWLNIVRGEAKCYSACSTIFLNSQYNYIAADLHSYCYNYNGLVVHVTKLIIT